MREDVMFVFWGLGFQFFPRTVLNMWLFYLSLSSTVITSGSYQPNSYFIVVKQIGRTLKANATILSYNQGNYDTFKITITSEFTIRDKLMIERKSGMGKCGLYFTLSGDLRIEHHSVQELIQKSAIFCECSFKGHLNLNLLMLQSIKQSHIEVT